MATTSVRAPPICAHAGEPNTKSSAPSCHLSGEQRRSMSASREPSPKLLLPVWASSVRVGAYVCEPSSNCWSQAFACCWPRLGVVLSTCSCIAGNRCQGRLPWRSRGRGPASRGGGGGWWGGVGNGELRCKGRDIFDKGEGEKGKIK